MEWDYNPYQNSEYLCRPFRLQMQRRVVVANQTISIFFRQDNFIVEVVVVVGTW
jgi:hypothetical protein